MYSCSRSPLTCPKSQCGTFTEAWVYGLYDKRIDDIFYVGSTIQQPGKRYSRHMQGRDTYNFREAWITSIIADGSLPLFFPLCRLTTECYHEVVATEHAIARELQAMGHTAMCDGSTPINLRLDEALSVLEQAIAKYLDSINEQARVRQWLHEMYIEPFNS